MKPWQIGLIFAPIVVWIWRDTVSRFFLRTGQKVPERYRFLFRRIGQ